MSHTATGEWKSFEIKMRRRRAERLVFRADVATEAGCFDDAHALLDEARKLWPGVPGIAEVESRLQTAETPSTVPALDTNQKSIRAAAAGIVLGTIAAVGTMGAITMTLYDRTIADLDVHVAAQTVTSAPSPAQPAPVMVAQEEEPRTGPALPAVNTAERDAAVSARTPPTPPAIVRASKLPALTSSRAAIADAGTTMSLGGIPAAQTVTAPPGPVLEPVRLASAPTASAGLPATTDAVDSMPIEPPQDGAIRGTLDRYADAYSQLDADAAQRVWPMVNRDALSRAFESLESQRVSLGDCRIQVDGTSARARCAGTATWTPKVGSGEHTDERSWTFELSKDAGRWQIVSARVQNR